ncbi:MaoC/PaaZ C-terminal domain-containing protein [Micromonospora sp. NPDC048871]|uniref:MaoC/PaaZ C-terminal domain-containing protein n=1 Tax=unclassified Micromonospora TaxID=2617518 RepID=UPI002E0DC63E|nr:MaoC/PaaZ C-terminal domain-containing protein [Micromonospora sp. NBC_01739]
MALSADPETFGAGLDPASLLRWRSVAERHWSGTDALLYALGVGAGQQDPAAELRFTTENSAGHPQAVLPTFAALFAADPPPLGDPAAVRHAEQSLRLHRELPVAGTARTTATVTAVHDQGSGALVRVVSRIRDGQGRPLATATAGFFVIGAGGFGGDRAPAPVRTVPVTAPDHEIHYPVPRDQALLYRLSGDRNPLHSDPRVAERAGLPQPLLHGLCTYGYAGRALLHAVAADPARLRGIDARFTAPVYPGTTLTVRIWRRPLGAAFQVLDGAGRVVLDRGAAWLR